MCCYTHNLYSNAKKKNSCTVVFKDVVNFLTFHSYVFRVYFSGFMIILFEINVEGFLCKCV